MALNIQAFISGLQIATEQASLPKFWEDYPEKNWHTFQDVLDEYAAYYNSLPPAQKEAVSKLFWEQVKTIGTPIIEDHVRADGKCEVYFLYPKGKLSQSKEKPEEKQDLYLQGDFHGYGSVDGRQRLLELEDTGIMLHRDSMPRESIVTYYYIQVEPSHRGQKPVPQHSSFFEDGKGFSPLSGNIQEFPDIPQSEHEDGFSPHSGLYGFDGTERVFRVSADAKHAHISINPINWPSLLSTETPSPSKRHFIYHSTLYSDKDGDLHHSEAKVTNQYHDDLQYSNGYNLSLRVVPSFNELDTNILGEEPILIKDMGKGKYKIWGCKEGAWQLTDIDSLEIPPEWKQHQTVFVSVTDPIFSTLTKGHTPYLPYANYTRAIQVFKPASKQTDDIIVVNDGTPYLITGILDHFEKMVEEKKISPNTAFVFINTLPGLKTTLSKEAAEVFNKDPSAKLDGMGVRLIDYRYGIDQYIDFIANKLFPKLVENKISVPRDPRHRVMIGSSLSGTASIYIALQRPYLFGAVVAQSPSPDNRAILSKIPREMLTDRNIHVSCGEFEQPMFAAANDNLSYAKELSKHLGKELHVGAHGHQFVAWNDELESTLPVAILEVNCAQQYRKTLSRMKQTDGAVSATSIEVETPTSTSITPFQITPKPSGDG